MKSDAEQRPRPGCRQRFIRFLSRLALLTVAAAWGIQAAWGESNWLTAFVTYAPPVIYLAVPAATGILALLIRDRRALLVSIVGLALALATVARPSLHAHRGPTRTIDSIRVVNWNVHGKIGEIPQIQAKLAELAPDIVCLQEANHKRFGECLPDAEMARGGEIMTLARGEVKSSRRLAAEGKKPIYRAPLETRVALPQGEVNVLNVHLYSYQIGPRLDLPSRARARHLTEEGIERRREELDLVLSWAETATGPKIVAGDFNTPPRGRLYGAVAALLTDTFAASGNGFGWSFTHEFPLFRIDYIWVDGKLKPLDCRTLPVGPSDHRPVVADLVLR